jgi:hypothetical protein
VPPEGFFPDGRPKGHRLPACGPCNAAFAKDEEYARDCFALGGHNPAALAVFQGAVTRSLIRPYARLTPVTKIERIKQDFTRVNLVSPGGVFLRQETAIHFNEGRIRRVLTKIVRGLHDHHLAEPLESEAITIYFQPADPLLNQLNQTTLSCAGRFEDVFAYGGARALNEQGDELQMWWLVFFQTFITLAVIHKPCTSGSHTTDSR